MTICVIVFGVLCIYLEILQVQGIDAANNWLTSLEIQYPKGMQTSDGYQSWGNYLGIFIGILFGCKISKYIDTNIWTK